MSLLQQRRRIDRAPKTAVPNTFQIRQETWPNLQLSSDPRQLWSYLERIGAVTRPHLYVCFSESSEGFSLQAFIPMTFNATFVVPAQ